MYNDPYIIKSEHQSNFPFEMLVDHRHETADSVLLIQANPPCKKENFYVTTNFKTNPNGWVLREQSVIDPSPMAWVDALYSIQNKYSQIEDDYIIVVSQTPYFLTESFGALRRGNDPLALLMSAINKELLGKSTSWKVEDIKQGMGHVVFVMESVDLSDLARL